jgi:hypothetical protein
MRVEGTKQTEADVAKQNKMMSQQRSTEVKRRQGENQWSAYPQTELARPTKVEK